MKKKGANAFSLKSFIIQVLRRASYRSPARSEALRQARIARNTYVCALCGTHRTRKEVQVDHIVPFVPLDAAEWDWNILIPRMFCGVEGLQVLCKTPCHAAKTKAENAARREFKKNVSAKKNTL